MRRVYAQFGDPGPLVEAIERLRAIGIKRLEAHTPIEDERVIHALGLPPSRVPAIVFVAGMLGAATGYGLQWLLNGVLYPLDVGGRPPHSPISFVPITFEMGILAAALAALFALLWLGKLVVLWRPAFEVPGFESVTRDGYWLEACPRGSDDLVLVCDQLLSAGAHDVTVLGRRS